MNKLFVIFDILQGSVAESLDMIGFIALLVGITVIIIKNPISALICLMLLFASVAVYLLNIGLNFIAFSYIIVYIGAVSILFLFILMLIDVRASELLSNNSDSIPLAIFMGGLIHYVIFEVLPSNIAAVNYIDSKMTFLTQYLEHELWLPIISNFLFPSWIYDVLFTTSLNWANNISETSHISAIGNIPYTSHNSWLFLASIVLLLAMIGAIVITIKQQQNNKKN